MKILKFTTIAITTALVLAACNKEDGITNEGLQPGQVNILTSIEGSSKVEARAAIAPDGSGTFAKDDVLHLAVCGSNAAPATYKYSQNTPLFWEQVKADAGQASSYTFCGWYNADNTLDLLTTSAFNAATATDPDLLLAVPATATEGETVTLPFRHAMHRLLINLSGDLNDLGVTHEQFNVAKVSLLNMNATATVDVKTGTVTPGEASEADGDYGPKTDSYEFIVAPQKVTSGVDWIKIELADMTFIYPLPVTLKDGTPLTQLESGKQLTLMLTLKKTPAGQTGVELSGNQISGWTDGGTITDDVTIDNPPSGDIDMTGKTVAETKAAIQAALDAGITEFKLTGPIANSGIDGSYFGSSFYNNTQLTKIDLTGATGWTAVECDGYDQTTETEIGLPAYAFRGCTNLTEVKLPAGVKAIGTQAFNACTSLTTINLRSVTRVGYAAFHGCTALADVSLLAAATLYADAFSGTGLVTVYLPQVTSISEGASGFNSKYGSFKDCTQLTTIIDAPLLTDIGYATFAGCTKLETVIIPDAETIGQLAFDRCESLKIINFENATTIGEQAFSRCKAATAINLPKATTIGMRAFWSCANLTEIELPEANLIKMLAFSACTTLETLRLPAATRMDPCIVDGCSSLTLIEVTGAGTFTSTEGGNLDNTAPFSNNFNTNPPFTSTACALVLNVDKKEGGTGVPLVSGNRWTGTTWKSISYK